MEEDYFVMNKLRVLYVIVLNSINAYNIRTLTFQMAHALIKIFVWNPKYINT